MNNKVRIMPMTAAAQSVNAAVKAAADKFGGIDILINNASAINLASASLMNTGTRP